ncbi:hypothetical protein TURU_096794 [Turdus rufiventris]|nr:hypothetical protein TURU_096794 [Turdus rufiventris]
MQQLVGSLQWLRNIILIPPEVMDPLNDLLKGTNPWEQKTLTSEVISSLNFIEHQMSVSTLTRRDSSTPVDLYVHFTKKPLLFGGEIRYAAKPPWTVINIDLPPKIIDRLQAGPTIFTDTSSLTSTAAAVWQSGEQWQCVKTTDPTLSVQQLEAAAIALACGLFPEEHLNIVTDSIFVATLCLAMSGPGVSVSTVAMMLEEVLYSQKGTISIIHINNHDPIKGFYQICNDKTDAAAKGVWTLKEALGSAPIVQPTSTPAVVGTGGDPGQDQKEATLASTADHRPAASVCPKKSRPARKWSPSPSEDESSDSLDSDSHPKSGDRWAKTQREANREGD